MEVLGDRIAVQDASGGHTRNVSKQAILDREMRNLCSMDDITTGTDRIQAKRAWGATRRAADALVLARPGEEPERTPEGGHARGMVRYTAVPARGMR